jgi:hypothetical protein
MRDVTPRRLKTTLSAYLSVKCNTHPDRFQMYSVNYSLLAESMTIAWSSCSALSSGNDMQWFILFIVFRSLYYVASLLLVLVDLRVERRVC